MSDTFENHDLSQYVVTDTNTEQLVSDITVGKVKKSKRSREKPYEKVDKKVELTVLRKKAQSLCKSYEQYRIVKRYKYDRLKSWIEEHEFDRDNQLRENVFNTVHKGYSYFLDFMTKGGGHVREQVQNDLSLRTSLETELSDYLKYLNNLLKIVALSTSDVFHGKLEQRKSDPPPPVNIEYFDPPQINSTDEQNSDENTAVIDRTMDEFETETEEEEVLSMPIEPEDL
mgnify:CR=1 FL=1